MYLIKTIENQRENKLVKSNTYNTISRFIDESGIEI